MIWAGQAQNRDVRKYRLINYQRYFAISAEYSILGGKYPLWFSSSDKLPWRRTREDTNNFPTFKSDPDIVTSFKETPSPTNSDSLPPCRGYPSLYPGFSLVSPHSDLGLTHKMGPRTQPSDWWTRVTWSLTPAPAD